MSDFSELSDVSESGRRKFVCTFPGCNHASNKKWRLTVHQRKHTGVRPFDCDVPNCGKSYTNSAHLKRHKALKHDEGSKHICHYPNCNKTFNYQYNLKRHILRNHIQTDYAFKCNICEQGFSRKKALVEHLYLHTGNKKFRCETCNKDFATSIECNKHKRQHKTYECECGETFTKWTFYCTHKRTVCRTVYKCPICDRVFKQQGNLKTHTLTHVVESQKDFVKCAECMKEFASKVYLVNHIQRVHKEKEKQQLKCTYKQCDVVLSNSACLKQHIKNVHEKVKEPKARKPRKDKGKSKKAMASVLSGVTLDAEKHKQIINSDNQPKIVVNLKRLNMDDGVLFKEATMVKKTKLSDVLNGQLLDADAVKDADYVHNPESEYSSNEV